MALNDRAATTTWLNSHGPTTDIGDWSDAKVRNTLDILERIPSIGIRANQWKDTLRSENMRRDNATIRRLSNSSLGSPIPAPPLPPLPGLPSSSTQPTINQHGNPLINVAVPVAAYSTLPLQHHEVYIFPVLEQTVEVVNSHGTLFNCRMTHTLRVTDLVTRMEGTAGGFTIHLLVQMRGERDPRRMLLSQEQYLSEEIKNARSTVQPYQVIDSQRLLITKV